MRYLYGISDEKFVKSKKVKRNDPRCTPVDRFKSRVHSYLNSETPFDKDDLSIEFKCSPDTLVNLAARVVDAMPLPPVYEWNNWQVCKWLRDTGFRQYQNTFRENYICGGKLLLLDAAALSAMNIKSFADIKEIAYGIRKLFFFEMTKYARSISLPWQYLGELYKLFRTSTGPKYGAAVRRSDLYRRMQILRAKCPNYTHWELLERWLRLQPPYDPYYHELIGGHHRFNLYKCKEPPAGRHPAEAEPEKECICIPPCRCFWTAEREYRNPWSLKCLPDRPPDTEYRLDCSACMPPCTCQWCPAKFRNRSVLKCLQEAFPAKYLQVVPRLASSDFELQRISYKRASIRCSYFTLPKGSASPGHKYSSSAGGLPRLRSVTDAERSRLLL